MRQIAAGSASLFVYTQASLQRGYDSPDASKESFLSRRSGLIYPGLFVRGNAEAFLLGVYKVEGGDGSRYF